MSGWIGDFFRFWWALFYWNTRKGWFCLQGAHRDNCPCQNSSDSGLPGETRCKAIVRWRHPERFRRVCPLLVATPDGLRCSVEAESVRPFWGRASVYLSGLILALYLVGTGTVYTVLRASGYEVAYATVVWPQNWHTFYETQEGIYLKRAQAAIDAGNTSAAILALEAACRINPQNYSAGLQLARLTLVEGQPDASDQVYERLLADAPEQRVPTARVWFRSLLARSAYDKIIPLASMMMIEDPTRHAVWLNALVFSARQSANADALATVRQENPHLPAWCLEVLQIEQLLLQNRIDAALPLLTQVHKQPGSPYLPYFQIDRLIRHDRTEDALVVLTAYGDLLSPHEATLFRLRLFEAQHQSSALDPQFDHALQLALTPAASAKISAHLVTHPSLIRSQRYHTVLAANGPPLSANTKPHYHAAYIAAVLSGDAASAEQVGNQLNAQFPSDPRTLEELGAVLREPQDDSRLRRTMPLVPLPTDVIYAILENRAATRLNK